MHARVLSWIWLVGGQESSDKNNNLLHSEWAKSRVRATRAKEEVVLLKEEMRRAIVTLEWRADWWMECTSLRSVNSALAEGLHAYAEDQASLQRVLQVHFLAFWKDPLSLPDDEENNIDHNDKYDDSNNDSENCSDEDDTEHSSWEGVKELYPDGYEDNEDDL
ncbi:hypothetical protein DXG01_006221 [Tephrocybe rancida]|nr:hypothetical protein DXG01_006221 [Tephrocybe rancida]